MTRDFYIFFVPISILWGKKYPTIKIIKYVRNKLPSTRGRGTPLKPLLHQVRVTGQSPLRPTSDNLSFKNLKNINLTPGRKVELNYGH
jgi:hypothetical protein